MARLSTTYDVFSAIGEPKRRELIERLIQNNNQMTVNQLVEETQWTQPMVSKHLKVLKQVNLVSEEKRGRQRLYRVEPKELRPIQDWMHQFEKYWGGSMDQLENYLEDIQRNGDKNDLN